MKNHIIGFALFTLIVGSSVFAYSALRSEDVELVVPPVKLIKPPMKIVQTNIIVKDADSFPVSFKLLDAVLDCDKNTLTTKVQLNWNGQGNPPKSVTFQVGFFSASNPDKNIKIASQSKYIPFDQQNSVTQTFVSTVVVAPGTFDPKENYYAYAGERSYQDIKQDGDTIQGIYYRIPLSEDQRLAEAVPVLLVHPK